jgi:hypothetical protein
VGQVAQGVVALARQAQQMLHPELQTLVVVVVVLIMAHRVLAAQAS